MGVSDWIVTDAAEYEKAYNRFGGSVFTHPGFVDTVSKICGLEPRYLASYDEVGELIGALPRWGNWIFGTAASTGNNADLMSLTEQRVAFDFGQMEIIYPLHANIVHTLPPGPTRLSIKHAENVASAEPFGSAVQGLFKTAEFGGLSKKFHTRHRYMTNRFLKRGGSIYELSEIKRGDFAGAYHELHCKRWNKPPFAFNGVEQFVKERDDMLCGNILLVDNNVPVAVHFVLMAESPEWINVEYINGGMDPKYGDLSVGSILLYANTSKMLEYAESKNKSLRYSFGYSGSHGYKARYCQGFPFYKSVTY